MTEDSYKLIYYLVLFAFFIIGNLLKLFKGNRRGDALFCSIIMLSIAFLLSSRGLNIGSDTQSYKEWFDYYSKVNLFDFREFFTFGGDPLFKIGLHVISWFTDYNGALFIISFCISFLTYCFSKQVVRICGFGSISLLFLLLMSSSVTWGGLVNVMRSGVGTAFFLLYLVALYERNIQKAIVWGLLGMGCHFSVAIFVILALIPILSRFPQKYYLFMFVGAIVVAAIGYSVLNIISFGDVDFEKAASYTQNIEQSEYKVGFRPTFVLYNSFFLFLIWKCKKYVTGIDEFLVEFFILSSVLFFLWFTIPYSNRIGNFSWIVIPPMIYFPLINKFRNIKQMPQIVFILFAILQFTAF